MTVSIRLFLRPALGTHLFSYLTVFELIRVALIIKNMHPYHLPFILAVFFGVDFGTIGYIYLI
jgi:tetrahydromethanopterin S-methyltransferase subunit E